MNFALPVANEPLPAAPVGRFGGIEIEELRGPRCPCPNYRDVKDLHQNKNE